MEPVTVVYKEAVADPSVGDLMALPRTKAVVCLPTLLSALNVNIDVILLPCVFCGGFCTLQDKLDFLMSGLKVVWKNNCFHAACKVCRRVIAAEEDYRYRECTVEADFIERCTGKSILDVTVRCIACMHLLGASEKLLAKANNKPFYLVRKVWRGSCRYCFAL